MAENKRFTKMSKKSKYAAYMYLAIAICVVAVMTVSIYSLSFTDDPGELGISIPDIPTPSLPDKTGTGDVSDTSSAAQVDGTESGVDDTVIEKPTFVVPLEGTVTKKYSMNALVYSSTMQDYRTHSGVDIKANEGDPVKAYTTGMVREIYEDDLMGRVVVLEHDYGLCSYYMNLADNLPDGLEVGKEVQAGDEIGYVGTTAVLECGDGPHLHFELTVNDELIDAYKEIKAVNG